MPDLDSMRNASRLAIRQLEKVMEDIRLNDQEPFLVSFTDQKAGRPRGCRLCQSSEDDGRIYRIVIVEHPIGPAVYLAFGTVCDQCDPEGMLKLLQNRVLELAIATIQETP